MHSASGAYWNNERDGMWSFKWEGGGGEEGEGEGEGRRGGAGREGSMLWLVLFGLVLFD